MSTALQQGLPARRAAWTLLHDVICHAKLLHEALDHRAEMLSRLPPADRALAEQLVRTTLRRRGQLQHILRQFLRKPLPRKACQAHAALLMGAAQVLTMRIPAHAAISTTVELLKQQRNTRHMAGLANAVLRRLAREGEHLLHRTPASASFPSWLRQRLQTAYGTPTLQEMAEIMVREPPLDITVKQAEQAQTWATRLQAELLPPGSLRIANPRGPVPTWPGYTQGAWWVQDAAAALPARLLGDVQGRLVADLCAAPGGKTAQLAAAGAHVTAVDISTRRLQRLRENLARLHLSADIITADVLTWQPAQSFDAILLDAPCTATGTFRRHPDVLFTKTAQQVRELTELQQRLLAHAATLLKPGGTLVYCVCSLLPEEGERQIERFLNSAAGCHYARQPVSAAEVGGLQHIITPHGDVRTLPHHAIGHSRGLDGFFIARLQRQP